jgi:hypothetical protein
MGTLRSDLEEGEIECFKRRGNQSIREFKNEKTECIQGDLG